MTARSNHALRRLAAGALKSAFIFTILACGHRGMSGADQAWAKVSRLGEYRGYSAAVYDGWVRSSIYLPMRDGVRIAIDIFRPTSKGKAAAEKLPVVWTLKRYQRASQKDGQAVNLFPDWGPHMAALLEHGYVLAAADSRGTGASFGIVRGVWTEAEALDAYEITEWLAAQPWSNGRIGMVGASYEGTNQLMAAAKKPPHLKAIMPAMAMFDIYDLAYPGGIFRSDLVRTWSELTREIDTQRSPAPVDEDGEGKLLKQALQARPQNRFSFDIVAPLRYRDGRDPQTGQKIYEAWQPAGSVREIRESGTAVYLICGWYDAYIRDAFLMFRNLGPRFKMVVLDCSHGPEDPTIVPEVIGILASEQLRWFDHWLKGIDNGVTREAPLQYQTNIEAAARAWHGADRWPLPGAKTRSFYFQARPSASIASVNDGRLLATSPREEKSGDLYAVDYSATSGQNTRWDNTAGGNFAYPDMAANDARGLTYTTEPLAEDLEVTGHPLLHLWVSSTARDGDFIAYLEEVDAKGFSRYVSEGCLRASHRSLNRPPYDHLGLPYHGSEEKEIVPLIPGKPVELLFDLLPVSNVFNKGNRLRLTIVCADKDNLETPAAAPAPRVTVYRSLKAASRLDLPVVLRKTRN